MDNVNCIYTEIPLFSSSNFICRWLRYSATLERKPRDSSGLAVSIVTIRITVTTEQRIDRFSCNRQPIFDFIFVINCHLSSISHRFLDISSRSRKPRQPTLVWAPDQEHPIEFRRQTYHAKTLRYFHVKPRDPNFSRLVTIHSHYRRQTDIISWQWPDIAMKLQRSAKELASRS